MAADEGCALGRDGAGQPRNAPIPLGKVLRRLDGDAFADSQAVRLDASRQAAQQVAAVRHRHGRHVRRSGVDLIDLVEAAQDAVEAFFRKGLLLEEWPASRTDVALEDSFLLVTIVSTY